MHWIYCFYTLCRITFTHVTCHLLSSAELLGSALLRNNWHIIDCIYLKCTIWWVVTYVYNWTSNDDKIMSISINPPDFLWTLCTSWHSVLPNSNLNSFPTCRQPLMCCHHRFFFIFCNLMWYSMYSFVGPVVFTQHNCFKIDSCCCIYQYCIAFLFNWYFVICILFILSWLSVFLCFYFGFN